MKQVYAEGSLVREGQLLFEIDPRPFQAALDQAKATLAQGEGRLAEANGQLISSKNQDMTKSIPLGPRSRTGDVRAGLGLWGQLSDYRLQL